MRKYIGVALSILVALAATAGFHELVSSARKGGVEVEYLVPFHDGSCYRLDNGMVTVQIEVGRKDGIVLRRLDWKKVTLHPAENPPYEVRGYSISCPGMKYPDRP